MRSLILSAFLLTLGCASPDAEQPPEAATKLEIGGDRPATLMLPSGHEGPLPLILALHGYTSSAEWFDTYTGLAARVPEGFALILAQGETDTEDDTYWNATDWCCAFRADPPADDVAYLTSLIEEARQHTDVSRVIAMGHSNGGFMSYRLACEERVDVVVSLAGTSYVNPDLCETDRAVSVLHIHGDADEVVRFGPTENHSGAEQELARWAERAGCSATRNAGTSDIDGGIEGEETVRTAWEGCADGHRLELWTLRGGDHSPRFDPPLADPVLNWLGI